MSSNNLISPNLVKFAESLSRQNCKIYPNFPKKGILFRDFSPVLRDPTILSYIADEFSN